MIEISEDAIVGLTFLVRKRFETKQVIKAMEAAQKDSTVRLAARGMEEARLHILAGSSSYNERLPESLLSFMLGRPEGLKAAEAYLSMLDERLAAMGVVIKETADDPLPTRMRGAPNSKGSAQ